MRKILMIIEYDGTDFSGWQYQPLQRTIQDVFQNQLAKFFKVPSISVMGSGRTDAGVHAQGLGVSFVCPTSIPLDGLLKGLNAILPHDIAVINAFEVPEDFSARKNAFEKRYRYQLWNHKIRSPLHSRNTSFAPFALNTDAMYEASRFLIGTHDFKSFQASGCTAKNTVRTLHSIDIIREGFVIQIDIRGNAFLRYMVRNIVGTLLEVGKGKQEPSYVKKVLGDLDRTVAGKTAEAKGLTLMEVLFRMENPFGDER